MFLRISNFARRASSSGKRVGERGATLVELLVVLTILSLLAAAAVPFAETAVMRQKERDLQETLREVRTAIDRFQDDWRTGAMDDETDAASEAGLPVTLDVLVEGVNGAEGETLRYLRRLPENPFAPRGAEFEEAWLLLGYSDPPDATVWNGEDVYDIRARTERTALDGSEIADW